MRGSSKRRGGSAERGARDRLPETRPFCRPDSADFSDFNADSTCFFANFSNSAWRRRASTQRLGDAPQEADRPCRVDSAASADDQPPFDSFSISPNSRVLPNASRREIAEFAEFAKFAKFAETAETPGRRLPPTSTSRQAQTATRSTLSNLLVPAPRRPFTLITQFA
ncbi:MAG: hypothetical protein IJE97_09065 [Thermoguttaceae bacterium]|nr:hypothetical protein [Thermoguttaceae bacterium]